MDIEHVNGKYGVRIKTDKYGVEFISMKNGFQWSGIPVDTKLLDMIQKTISEFKEKNKELWENEDE